MSVTFDASGRVALATGAAQGAGHARGRASREAVVRLVAIDRAPAEEGVVLPVDGGTSL